MTPYEHRPADLLDDYWSKLVDDAGVAPPPDLDPATAALARHVAQQQHSLEPDDAFIASLGRRLATASQAASRAPAHGRGVPRVHVGHWLGHGRRRLAAGLALLVAAGGIWAYLTVTAPMPASAQTVLRHTAARLHVAAPGQVVHDVSTVHTVNAPGVNAGVGGIDASTAPDVTVDRWTQWDANGATVRDDNAIIGGTGLSGPVLQRSVQVGRTTTLYSAQTHQTVVMTATQTAPPEGQVIPDPFNAVSLRRFVLDAGRGGNQETRLLPQQTVDGATVYVVQVTHTLPADPEAQLATTPHRYTVTLYVTRGSYTIRKMEIVAANAKGVTLTSSTMKVVTYTVLPSSAVPPTVFSAHNLTRIQP